jgi:hypothetical protein
MHNRNKRVMLYGAASFVLSGIGVAWVKADSSADVYTLLGSAEVQLKMAFAIPATDKQGKASTSARV